MRGSGDHTWVDLEIMSQEQFEQFENLEKKLNKQAKSLNTQKKKGASLASAMLEDLKSDLERGDLTTEQYEDHVAILEQIASGTASVADIQEAVADLGEDATE